MRRRPQLHSVGYLVAALFCAAWMFAVMSCVGGCIGDGVVTVKCRVEDERGTPLAGVQAVLRTTSGTSRNRHEWKLSSDESGCIGTMRTYNPRANVKGFELVLSKSGYKEKRVEFSGSNFTNDVLVMEGELVEGDG